MKILSKLLLALLLTGCASHSAIPSQIPMPIRTPLMRVGVHEVDKDGICPGDGFFYMSEAEFRALSKNVINTEAYIAQLELLLKSLQGPIK